MNEETMIRRDRMRFTKNTQSSRLTYFAILFDVLYFILLYGLDVGTYYYNYMIGISVLYNLVFMLAAFLASEGVKNYKKGYTYPLLVLGVIQIARIFIIPMKAHNTVLSIGGVDTRAMGNGTFTWMLAFLILSAVCLFAAAVINFMKCNALESHMKMMEQNSAEATQATAQKSV